jgi:hypothetical protein
MGGWCFYSSRVQSRAGYPTWIGAIEPRFDWSAALVGGGSVLAFVLVGVALLVGARRVHRPKLAV